MDNIHLQSCDVIGPLLAESQSHLMIDDVHLPPTAIFQTLIHSPGDRGLGGCQTYQYFIFFFTLSVKGGRGKVQHLYVGVILFESALPD